MKKINQFLKFEPILKEKIWGGEKLMHLLNKNSDMSNIGESWEVSDVENDTSVVASGEFIGEKLKQLIADFKGDLLGEKVYQQFGETFPLLIKFIDAKEALSIQLHPNDVLAKKRHNSFGKTEMWYVLQADKEASLIVGFKEKVTPETYVVNLKNKTLIDILNVDEVSEGDVYFIEPGIIHAIGAGILLAEIQQTSDITYRLYDWDRLSLDGTYRDLHTDEAIHAIDYEVQENYKSTYSKFKNTLSEMVSCAYFTTNILPVSNDIQVSHLDKDSFVVYMCVKGEVMFVSQNQQEKLSYGQTLLVPSCLKEFEILTTTDSELLEIFIK
jgi:mannose-6-phosphate isomerase